MKHIPLGQTRRCKHTDRYVAIVDPIDFKWAQQFNWTADVGKNGRVYAVRRQLCSDGVKRKTYMHREIWARAHGEALSSRQVDHKEHGIVSGLDNRRTNLRLATPTQNLANGRRRSDNTSGYKGVSFNKRLAKWQAYINNAGTRLRLGLFPSAEEAAAAYDAAARNIFGDYARLNLRAS